MAGIDRPHLLAIGDAASVHVEARVAAMASRGWMTEIVTPQPGRSHAGREWVTSSTSPLTSLLSTIKAVCRSPADLVHVHYAASLGGWVFSASGRREPLVVTVMGGDILDAEQYPLSGLARWMTRQLLHRADWITAKSSLLTETLTARHIPADRIETIVWGVDTTRFRPDPMARAQARTDWKIAADAEVILSPRMLRPFYNILMVLDAFAAIARQRPKAVLVLTEYGAEPDYRTSLAKHAIACGIDERVVWAGAVAPEAMPNLYLMSDLVVSLAPSDGFPQTILEALACGRPCVATRLERYGELVTDGCEVVLCDLNPAAVTSAMLSVLSNPEIAQRMGDAGRRLVETRADFSIHANHVNVRCRNLLTIPRRNILPAHIRLVMWGVLFGWAVMRTVWRRKH